MPPLSFNSSLLRCLKSTHNPKPLSSRLNTCASKPRRRRKPNAVIHFASRSAGARSSHARRKRLQCSSAPTGSPSYRWKCMSSCQIDTSVFPWRSSRSWKACAISSSRSPWSSFTPELLRNNSLRGGGGASLLPDGSLRARVRTRGGMALVPFLVAPLAAPAAPASGMPWKVDKKRSRRMDKSARPYTASMALSPFSSCTRRSRRGPSPLSSGSHAPMRSIRSSERSRLKRTPKCSKSGAKWCTPTRRKWS
mmetsp:Transcript_15219/g.45051  ORF Transcript_15219/g.45051 Transcript_15219/m.45051 type:complete len:251 (+) Transcript_15219:585-1337(+)